jgi:hypothetical protein
MDAGFPLGGIEAKQIENEATDDGKIGPGVLCARAWCARIWSSFKATSTHQ